MRLQLFPFLALLAPTLSFAQPIDWAEIHNLTMRGIDRLYNLEVEQAVATFDSVRRMAPSDPRGYFFGSMVHFWLFTLARNDAEYETFLDKSDEVITVCENLLDVNEKDAVARFYLGGIYGYRGLAHQVHNSMLKAVVEGRKGYTYLKEAVEEKPDLYDAQMGFGLFKYLVAKVPRSLSWVLNLVGFSGDAEGGIAMVRNAAEHGVYTRTEASFYLAQFLFVDQKRDEALAIMHRLMAKYPDNSLFLLTYASWQSRMGNVDEALAYALKAVAVNNRKSIKYGEEFAYSTLGSIYFARNEFDRARENLELFLTRVRSRDYVSNYIYYRLAIAQELTGYRQKAVETCKEMHKVHDKERAGDSYYYRKGQELITAPISEAESLLITAGNDAGRRSYDHARALYMQTLQTSGDADLRLRALYGLMNVSFETEQFAETVQFGRQLVTIQPIRETWLIPHGYFKLGQAYAKLHEPLEARRAFQKISEYDDYDFEHGLTDRVTEELEKLQTSGP